jgi:hypothetical protein
MRKYKLLKDIVDPRWKVTVGSVFTKKLNTPDSAYTLEEGVHPLHPKFVENNPTWFEPI